MVKKNIITPSLSPRRRLLAIMFTDIEGYTAIMQKSEEQALFYREIHRKIFNQ